MDFFVIKERTVKGVIEVYPDFRVRRSEDLMVRGKSFYAIWDAEKNIWSTDEYECQRLIDKELYEYAQKIKERTDAGIYVRYMSDFSSNSWVQFKNYISHVSDNSHQLDENLTFENTEIAKKDYVSKRLPYALQEGSFEAYDKLMTTLYDPEERKKLEWAVGSIISGDSKYIQKFIVLYGDPGAGKSTFLGIVEKLFPGYYTAFDAKTIVSSSNAFSTEIFKNNPLVAIQHDGDLSRIEDNTKLNSIVSHEEMAMNEKYKPSYMSRINCFLFLASNKPVKITDAKAGVIRRLIDVTPSGRKIPKKQYDILKEKIDFELGAIAYHCLQVYKALGKGYYNDYRPLQMIFKTDVFFNFVESSYSIFSESDGITLTQAYDIYKKYCDESFVEFKLPRYKFREELKNYFSKFDDIIRIDGKQVRSYYSGFLKEKFYNILNDETPSLPPEILSLNETKSIIDSIFSKCPAQYANSEGHPPLKWENNKVILEYLDTSKLHFVKIPSNVIVIDFDIKDENGNKSAKLNLEAASKWPSTYAEFSKSGNGIHLYYYYDGDIDLLSHYYSKDIEIKTFTGNASIRRKLSKCNNIPIATINNCLPKKEKKMINFDVVQNERQLRAQIWKCLRKEVHANTTPNMYFIKHILDEAYNSGIVYDVEDLRPSIFTFALHSTNGKDICVKLMDDMKFKSETESNYNNNYTDEKLSFFDCEVYPNLLVVCWLYEDANKCVSMINPSPKDMETFLRMKLAGFNNRKYDNHILYGRYLGDSNKLCYLRSSGLVTNSKSSYLTEAFNASYIDIYDMCSKKQSLKKWEIELKQPHMEMPLDWNKPVPEELWPKVVEYCCNDVMATRAVFLANQSDYRARQILAEISKLFINDTTNHHTMQIILEGQKYPQDIFHYRDLSKPVFKITEETYNRLKKNTILPLPETYSEDMEPLFKPYTDDIPFYTEDNVPSILPYFPGYKFEFGKSTYRGIEVGEGGFVYAEPGIYENVWDADIASMHPTSMELEDHFDKYTDNLSALKQIRILIKHGEYDKVKTMFDGKLSKYLGSPEEAKQLSYALKIAINSVYGLTAAKFENPFHDPRNKDNFIAKRGALFMIDLMHAVQEKGYTVAHIKTDSIKIPNADDEIKKFVIEFGAKYGYVFETEAVFKKMCLVNNAVYIAQYDDGTWTATGAEFAHPFIFKKMFSHEDITFDDLCETKTVTSTLYLDVNEDLPDVSAYETELEKRQKQKKYPEKRIRLNPDLSNMSDDDLKEKIKEGHNYRFVGRAGRFCPIKSGKGGGLLLREKDKKYYAVTGTIGYRWLESELVEGLKEDDIDMSYFDTLIDGAKASINKFGDFDKFVS